MFLFLRGFLKKKKKIITRVLVIFNTFYVIGNLSRLFRTLFSENVLTWMMFYFTGSGLNLLFYFSKVDGYVFLVFPIQNSLERKKDNRNYFNFLFILIRSEVPDAELVCVLVLPVMIYSAAQNFLNVLVIFKELNSHGKRSAKKGSSLSY